MLKNFRSKYSENIYIEFGSYIFKAFIPSIDKKFLLPSVIYLPVDYSEVKAIGDDAKSKVSNSKFKVIKPFESGTISDFKATELFFRFELEKIVKKLNFFTRFMRPNIFLSVHSTFSEVELSAITDAIASFGASSISFINEGVASHFALKEETQANSLICKIGFTVTDLLLIVDNDTYLDMTFKFGIKNFIRAINIQLKQKYLINVSEPNILKVIEKIDLNSKNKKQVSIQGKNLRTGLPLKIKIDLAECNYIINNELNILLNNLKRTLEKAPNHVIDKIIEHGLSLSGGGLSISGIKEKISNSIGIKTNFNTNIFSSVEGLEHISSNLELKNNFEVRDLILI